MVRINTDVRPYQPEPRQPGLAAAFRPRALIFVCLVIAGCAHAPDKPAPPGATAAIPGIGLVKTPPPLEEAPPIAFDKGQCALVLWTKAQPPRRVLTALNNPAHAVIKVAGVKSTLDLADQDGNAVFGYAPHLVYSGGGYQAIVDLVFDGSENLLAGAVARSGTIELRDREGWSAVTPVGGIVACNGG